jgi:putative hydrolase of the HAD superfamily
VIRAVFFDLDDTLCDARPAFAAGRRAAFAEALMQAPGLTEQTLSDAWARTNTDLFRAMDAGALTMAQVRDTRFRQTLASAGIPDDRLADALNALLGELQLERLRAFDDVAALGALRERGVFVGIITNGADDAQTDSQRTKAERLGLLREVDGFWVSDTMGYRKPDPRAFLPALSAAGCDSERCLYVGDSLVNDIAGANAAGMRSVLLLRGSGSTESPAVAMGDGQARPWRTVRSLWETLALLGAF